MQRSMSNPTAKTLTFRSFDEFEGLTGILFHLKHINELTALGLKLFPETDGSYRPKKVVLDYLKTFCHNNPGYHIVSETHYSDVLSEQLGSEKGKWIIRTFVNYCANIRDTRRYYLADGCADKSCQLVEMMPIVDTNVIPFRRS